MGYNINNQRAEFAYNKVSEISKSGGTIAKEFRSLARSFPAMLQLNGFGTSMAFLYSKRENGKSESYSTQSIESKTDKNRKDKGNTKSYEKNAHSLLYDIIQDWIKKEIKEKFFKDDRHDCIMKWITESSSDKYRLMTKETFELLIWVKRFAEGMLGDGK